MNDTRPEVNVLYRERLLALSNADRFRRGARMFETAREMVLASMGEGLSEVEIRQGLLRRFYGRDLTAEELDRAETALVQRARGNM